MFEVRSGKSEPACGGGACGSAGGGQDADRSAPDKVQRDNRGDRKGKLYVVGIGPGGKADRTLRAIDAIEQSDAVFGYKRYIELTEDLLEGKEVFSSGMTHEVERCLKALEVAASGKTVSMLSSGDPGVYGMAGLVLELAEDKGFDVDVEIVTGISAANSAAARLGAPLMLDYACISISDILVPWDKIKQRLEKVAAADLVVALYNPRSKKRVKQLEEAAEIFRKYREPGTPVGIATAVGSEDESIEISDLENFLEAEIGMRSIVIVGNSESKVINGRLITPRGYEI